MAGSRLFWIKGTTLDDLKRRPWARWITPDTISCQPASKALGIASCLMPSQVNKTFNFLKLTILHINFAEHRDKCSKCSKPTQYLPSSTIWPINTFHLKDPLSAAVFLGSETEQEAEDGQWQRRANKTIGVDRIVNFVSKVGNNHLLIQEDYSNC